MNSLVLLVVLPLFAAFIIPVVAKFSPKLALFTGPVVLCINLLLIMSAWIKVGGGSEAIFLGGFLPPVGIVFYIDHFSLLFSGLIAGMVLIVWPWGVKESRLYSLYMLLSAASFGLVLSADLFNLYVFYELLAVATYGIIAKQSNSSATAASLRYLFISSAGSVMLLLGIAIIYTLTGTLNIAHLATLSRDLHGFAGLSAFALIAIGAGVKAEMFPVNSWVAEVYGTIPRQLSALLAGLISKLAVILIIRVLLMMFQQQAAFDLLLVVGMLGVISGEMVAWRAKDMIRMLSFSSIAQLGLIFIAFSIAGSKGLWIGMALMLHHLLVKGGLFLMADRFTGHMDKLKGLAKHSPMAAAVFLVFVLSLLGVPPFPGFWIKLLLILNLAEQGGGLYYVAIGIILLATVIETAYIFKFVRILYQKADEDSAPINKNYSISYTFAKIFALLLLVSMVFVSPISHRLKDMANHSASPHIYINKILPTKQLGDRS